MGALFLAAKVEETPKQFRDLINVFHHLFEKRDGAEKPEPIDTSKQVITAMYNNYFTVLIISFTGR